jgi:hypothetical protein
MQSTTVESAKINFADNQCRFGGEDKGHYEVWFLTLNDRATGCGFWFRYTIDVPEGSTKPESGLWGSFFDARDQSKTFGIKRYFSAEAWQTSIEAESKIIGVNQCALLTDRLYGSLAEGKNEISWDLKFVPAAETFHHIDENARKLFKPKTLICAPNLAVEFSGKVKANNQEFLLDRAPGCQQHIWGSKHAESWAWAHCNLFEGEPDAIFEGLSARPRRGPVTMPPLTLAYLRFRGQEYRFNTISYLFKAKNQFGDYDWQFKTGDSTVRLRGEADASPKDMIQVEYPDPDGDRTFCINSEIGNLKLTLEHRTGRFSKWQTLATLTSRGTTHFERASRIRNSNVPLI